MELVLIRHGRPERIDHDPNGADPGLTDLGHRQAKAMAHALTHETLGAIYVSPQLRALHTADPLAAAHDHTPDVVAGIAEFDLGHPSYIPGDEAPPLTRQELDELTQALVAPAFRDRVLGSVGDIVARHSGETVAAVCHGGVISTVLSDVLGTDPTVYFSTDYTSVTRVRVSRSGRRSMASFNERHWLNGLS